ncbi:MAG: HAD-IIB family hydrolase [Deltaproteobacteria bacterium]|nr:HAD-IIB family hydrolase [Deltaproteobacteria bacterium]
MQPFESMPRQVARQIVGVFTDIDGTLTDDGKLSANAYLALWRLAEAGLKVVPVTGRPAGWCDAIARQWPVHAVVGENGALAFYEENGRLERIYHRAVAARDPKRLEAIRAVILREVPGARVAKDQPYRQFDLAIDFREEPPDLGLEAAAKIKAVFERHGAHAKISNIHVNGWLGDYDKLSMVKQLAAQHWGVDLDRRAARYLFCGDSPNDEPMFAFFPNACGVANVQSFKTQMTRLPKYVTRAPGGAGFAEMVDVLLARR